MKRLGLILFCGTFVLFFYSGTPEAFHSGGVAECGGCHSMHTPKAGGSFLLIGTDPSSTCLTCHMHAGDTGPSSYHIATAEADMPVGVAPLQRTPGGDFGWLRKTYSFTVRGTIDQRVWRSPMVTTSWRSTPHLSPTRDNLTAPGGTFPSGQLGCTSCHDPHGRVRRRSDGSYATGAALGGTADPIIASGSYDNSATPAAGQAVGTYRLLRGLNDNSVTGVTFTGVAIAVTPSTYNRTEAATQTRTAYGATGINTWGNWCASCHPAMHSSGNYVHPVDQNLGGTVATAYNAYVKSGDLTGVVGTSFTSLVPFAENTGDIATLQLHAKNNDSVPERACEL